MPPKGQFRPLCSIRHCWRALEQQGWSRKQGVTVHCHGLSMDDVTTFFAMAGISPQTLDCNLRLGEVSYIHEARKFLQLRQALVKGDNLVRLTFVWQRS